MLYKWHAIYIICKSCTTTYCKHTTCKKTQTKKLQQKKISDFFVTASLKKKQLHQMLGHNEAVSNNVWRVRFYRHKL